MKKTSIGNGLTIKTNEDEKEFFDEEKVFSMPCLTVDAYGEKAKELICLIAENCNAEEIFIGGFFEKKSFIDEECENTVFIKEYLDENNKAPYSHFYKA